MVLDISCKLDMNFLEDEHAETHVPFDPLDVIILCPFCKRVGGNNPKKCDFCGSELPFYAVQKISKASSDVKKPPSAPLQELVKEKAWSIHKHELATPNVTKKVREPNKVVLASHKHQEKRFKLIYKNKNHHAEGGIISGTKLPVRKLSPRNERDRGELYVRKLFGSCRNGFRSETKNLKSDSSLVQRTINTAKNDTGVTSTVSSTLPCVTSKDNQCIKESASMQKRICPCKNKGCNTDPLKVTSRNLIQEPKKSTTNFTGVLESQDCTSAFPKQQNSVNTIEEPERTDLVSPTPTPSPSNTLINTWCITKFADSHNSKNRSSTFTRAQCADFAEEEEKETANSSFASLPDNTIEEKQLTHTPNFDSSLAKTSPNAEGTININNQKKSTVISSTSLLNGYVHKIEPPTVFGTSNNADCISILPNELNTPNNSDEIIQSSHKPVNTENVLNSTETPTSSSESSHSSESNHNSTKNISNGLKRNSTS